MPNFLGTVLPKRWIGFHDESTVTVGAALTTTHDSSQYHLCFSEIGTSGTALSGDTFTQSFWVRSGTYTLKILGVTKSSCGKMDTYVDNVAISAGLDWYSAGTTYNVEKTISSIVVATDGLHVLKVVTNSKNASSSAYEILLTVFNLYQAAD